MFVCEVDESGARASAHLCLCVRSAPSVVDNVVTFSMELYPSRELAQQFITDQPLIYAVLVGAIFLVTSLAFVTYDYLVTNNQNRLTRMAG